MARCHWRNTGPKRSRLTSIEIPIINLKLVCFFQISLVPKGRFDNKPTSSGQALGCKIAGFHETYIYMLRDVIYIICDTRPSWVSVGLWMRVYTEITQRLKKNESPGFFFFGFFSNIAHATFHRHMHIITNLHIWNQYQFSWCDLANDVSRGLSYLLREIR